MSLVEVGVGVGADFHKRDKVIHKGIKDVSALRNLTLKLCSDGPEDFRLPFYGEYHYFYVQQLYFPHFNIYDFTF